MTNLPPSPLKITAGRLIAQRFERETNSIIKLSQQSKAKEEWGVHEYVVLQLGPDKLDELGNVVPYPCKVGDKIMPLFNQCLSFAFAGHQYLIMPLEAVAGVEDQTAMTFLEGGQKLIHPAG
jgi:co-chaperonin GroES (HSP10)